jgi:hypothetical protein
MPGCPYELVPNSLTSQLQLFSPVMLVKTINFAIFPLKFLPKVAQRGSMVKYRNNAFLTVILLSGAKWHR